MDIFHDRRESLPNKVALELECLKDSGFAIELTVEYAGTCRGHHLKIWVRGPGPVDGRRGNVSTLLKGFTLAVFRIVHAAIDELFVALIVSHFSDIEEKPA